MTFVTSNCSLSNSNFEQRNKSEENKTEMTWKRKTFPLLIHDACIILEVLYSCWVLIDNLLQFVYLNFAHTMHHIDHSFHNVSYIYTTEHNSKNHFNNLLIYLTERRSSSISQLCFIACGLELNVFCIIKMSPALPCYYIAYKQKMKLSELNCNHMERYVWYNNFDVVCLTESTSQRKYRN